MPAFRKQSTDNPMSTDNKSDNRTITVREPDQWLGQTANQALFFVTLLKLVQSIYDFKQLITTATVTMKDGKKAVFSAEHALEHAKGDNIHLEARERPRATRRAGGRAPRTLRPWSASFPPPSLSHIAS